MKKKVKQKMESVNDFHCCEKVFSRSDFTQHITTVHGYKKGTKSRRSLLQALDGPDWYSNTFEWEIPCGDKTIKVTQVSAGPREPYFKP